MHVAWFCTALCTTASLLHVTVQWFYAVLCTHGCGDGDAHVRMMRGIRLVCGYFALSAMCAFKGNGCCEPFGHWFEMWHSLQQRHAVAHLALLRDAGGVGPEAVKVGGSSWWTRVFAGVRRTSQGTRKDLCFCGRPGKQDHDVHTFFCLFLLHTRQTRS